MTEAKSKYFPQLLLLMCFTATFAAAGDPIPIRKNIKDHLQSSQNSNKAQPPPIRDFSAAEAGKIKFSQTGISPFTTGYKQRLNTLSKVMKNQQFDWNKSPIEVVEMKPGEFASLDNRRLAAAQTANVPVKAIVYKSHQQLPTDQQNRFSGATTYGGAVFQRARTGSFDSNSIPKDFTGFPKRYVRIRGKDRENLQAFQEAGFDVSRYKRTGPYRPPATNNQPLSSGSGSTYLSKPSLQSDSGTQTKPIPPAPAKSWAQIASQLKPTASSLPPSSRPTSPIRQNTNIKPTYQGTSSQRNRGGSQRGGNTSSRGGTFSRGGSTVGRRGRKSP